MMRSVRVRGWFWSISVVLGLCVVGGVWMLYLTRNQAELNSTASETIEPSVVVSPSSPTIEPPVAVIDIPPQLPRLDFAPGSVEEACGFNDFPPYHSSTFESDWDSTIPLASEECWSTMESHVGTINPFHSDDYSDGRHPFEFVVLEEPLTFARIFADPTGDMLRVQDALYRSECLLSGDKSNWELKESCHAEALLNYALINRICLGSGWNREHTYFPNINNLTPKQDRLAWKKSLEEEWVEMKCESLDQTLEFSSEQYPELHKLVMSFQSPTAKIRKSAQELLIELSARLGDEAAGLTASFPQSAFRHPASHYEEGYKFGRFAELLSNTTWQELALKQVPNADRFFQIFHMLAKAESREVDTRKAIQFDYGQLVHHMCVPPTTEALDYITADGYIARFTKADIEVLLELEPEELRDSEIGPEEIEEFLEPKSCKEVVYAIRQQREIRFLPMIDVLDKFEKAALEKGVYE
ncbi:MAG: hypothetical protein F4W92_08970 [Gammaproteobacteria bacterium]|nr:hypothetical protein [Gammaproteobacteria bacterium]